MATLYPPGPAQAPANFTAVSQAYRTKVILVLISLVLSLVFYLALVVGSAWLCKTLVTAPWPHRIDRGYAFLRIAGIIASGLLFLYLLKGLFKRSRQDSTLLVEITEEDQPALFEFIHHVCADTGAPRPHKVYLSPEVNAAVFYKSSFLSLLLPTPKNLLIGLGLVSNLNLSEFKAVLAHEFGHFSQKSMKLGSYVYIANKVFGDIIYGRDWLDDLVHQAKNIDIRIAIFVWVFLGLLWVLRKVLEGVFKLVNLFNLSLMREMEFHADRVAVSVTGSDAIVHGLVRVAFADQAFRQLAADLWAAADHGLYSRDMFHHFPGAAEQLRRKLKKPDLGKPPAHRGPEARAFEPEDKTLAVPMMWSTHPSNFDRETSAKDPYLACPHDERSAWLLFTNRADACFDVTQRYYTVVHKPEGEIDYAAAEAVQRFIDDEYAETTYPERYRGFYDNRYLELTEIDKLLNQQPVLDGAAAFAAIEQAYGEELQSWVEQHHKRLDDHDLLIGLQNGQRVGLVAFRGRTIHGGDVERLLKEVQGELENDRKTKADYDSRLLTAHLALARQRGQEQAEELARRYRFHVAIQDMHRQIIQGINDAQGTLSFASSRGGRGELSEQEFADVRAWLNGCVEKVFQILDAAEKQSIPALKNMPAGGSLRAFLLQKPVIRGLSGADQTIDGAWVQGLMAQLGELQEKLARLLFKSMGGILALQERIAAPQQVDANAPTSRPA